MLMMALISFIMITSQGFAAVMTETGEVESLVEGVSSVFGENQAAAAAAMLIVGLVVTMGIGSSFSTLPIITVILDRKSTRLNSSHVSISYAVFCLKKKK